MTTELHTPRLLLRQWRDTDRRPWHALNADPEVREFLGDPLTRADADAVLNFFRADLETRDWGWWALALRDTGELIGMAGLDPVDEDQDFTGVELGWRLARSHWGRGYATEAGRAVIAHAFEVLRFPELLAITAAANSRSQSVMRRLGMTHVRDFTDPTQPPHLAASVLYQIQKPS
jgi:RimJ/RimL family protein N-acetyltransferase